MATVQVVVVDESGHPLVGVTVAAYSLANFPEIAAYGVTDPAGSVALTTDGPCFYDAFDRRGVSYRDRNYAGKVQIQIVSFSNYMNADYVVDASGYGTHLTLFGASGALQAAMASAKSKFIWLCTSHTETVSAQEVLPDFALNQQIIVASGTRERAVISVTLASTTPLIQMPFPGGVSGSSLSFKSFRFTRVSGTGSLIGPKSGGPTLPDIEFENMDFKNGGSTFNALVGGSLLTAMTSANLTVRGCTGDGVLVLWQLGAISNGLGRFLMEDCNMSLDGINRQSSSTSVDWGASGSGTIVRNNVITHRNVQVMFQQNYTAPIWHFDNNVIYSAYAGICLITGNVQDGSNVHVCNNSYRAAAAGAQFWRVGSATSNIKNVIGIGNSLEGPGSGTAISTLFVNTGALPESIQLWPNSYRGWTTNFDGTAGGATDDWTDIGTDGKLAHSGLSGLTTGDDHTQYILKTTLTTTGDLMYASAANTPARLAIGANTTLLVSNGTIPVWTALASAIGHNMLSASHLDTTAAGVSAGSLIRGNSGGTAWEELVAATNGWVLTLVAGLPEWVATSAGGRGGGMVTMHADTEQVEWTNQPAALTELFGLTNHRTKIDLTNASNVRLVARVLTAGAVGSKLRAQYSTDEVTWNYLDGGTGPTVPLDGAAPATVASAVVTLTAGAHADVYLRIVGIGGDAATDPAVGLIVLMFDTVGGGGTVAPVNAHYVTTQAEGSLSNEVSRQFLSNYYADTYPSSPNTMDDEFDDTSGNSGTVNGLNARWAWRNQGTSTIGYGTQGYATLTAVTTAAQWRIIEQVEPAAQDYTVTCKISVNYSGTTVKTASHAAGLVLVDSAGGDLYAWCILADTNGLRLWGPRYTNVSTYNADTIMAASANTYGMNNVVYLRISYVNSTNTYYFWYSADGIGWLLFANRVDSGVGAVVPDRVGVGIIDINATDAVHIDWFRRTA